MRTFTSHASPYGDEFTVSGASTAASLRSTTSPSTGEKMSFAAFTDSTTPSAAFSVIAVPTSVGYGASFGGLAALLAMLSSCAAGVTVVNIDNGFGAGYAAAVINRIEGA